MRSAVTAGSVTADQVSSAILGNERTVWTCTPPGYKPDGGPYPLLLLFDGDAYKRGFIAVFGPG